MKLQFLFVELIVQVLLVGTPHYALAQAAKAPPEPIRSTRVETQYKGGLVNPPLPKPKFTLEDTSGVPFDLIKNTQGYVTLLFFGYTHCPDMCPLQMAMIASAKGRSSATWMRCAWLWPASKAIWGFRYYRCVTRMH